jgi:hypothetical protein
MQVFIITTGTAGFELEIDSIIPGHYAAQWAFKQRQELRAMDYEKVKAWLVEGEEKLAQLCVADMEQALTSGKPFGRKACKLLAEKFDCKVGLAKFGVVATVA